MRALAVLVTVAGLVPLQLSAAAAAPAEGPQPTIAAVSAADASVHPSATSLKIRQISAGGSFTCALTASRAVKCWGENQDGELGDGTTTERHSPTSVVGLGAGVKAVSSGYDHACAITGAGAVVCWGSNSDGQLGDGTQTDRHVPVQVSALTSGVKAVSAGGFYSCAITAAGAVECWGDNLFGGLGDGTTEPRSTPVQVIGLTSGVKAIATSSDATCAITSAGAVKCWGWNESGQLGNGTKTDSAVPVPVVGLSKGVKAIAGGESFFCAITSAGAVKCWGSSFAGQLGNGSRGDRSTPVQVKGLTKKVRAIATGTFHACAVTHSGAAKCWGSNGQTFEDGPYGQLGNGSRVDRSTPASVKGLGKGVRSLTAGEAHTCALTSAGGVRCWGNNTSGQLGDRTTKTRFTQVRVYGLR